MSKSYNYKGNAPVRLNKWMAELGLCSRREADALIAAGGVKIDDLVVAQAGHKIEPFQTLTLSPAAEEMLQAKFTAVLNKPVDYVSAQPEAGQTPAARLLTRARGTEGSTPPGRDASLAPLGRLDQDSRGLLLLSQDGVLAKAIIGPQHTLEKEYLVTVRGDITTGKITLLCNGLVLDGKRLKPAQVERIEGQQLRFILKEGRKRQIRRMCDLVGLHVVDLLRIRIGPLRLEDLEEGKWRPLKSRERAALIAASLPEQPKRLRDETGKPIHKGRSFVGRGERNQIERRSTMPSSSVRKNPSGMKQGRRTGNRFVATMASRGSALTVVVPTIREQESRGVRIRMAPRDGGRQSDSGQASRV